MKNLILGKWNDKSQFDLIEKNPADYSLNNFGLTIKETIKKAIDEDCTVFLIKIPNDIVEQIKKR
jgi:hypothetical protein